MQNLSQYIERINIFRELFKEEPIDINSLSTSDISSIKSKLESDLSPENLFCDGEISGQEARNKEMFLYSVHKELETLTKSNINLCY